MVRSLRWQNNCTAGLLMIGIGSRCAKTMGNLFSPLINTLNRNVRHDAMLICGDARMIPLADKSVNCCVTSPPYWGLRDYGVAGQLGLERTPEEYIVQMVQVFREVKRVLRDDGTLWLNMGDSYAGSGQGFGDTKTTNKSNGSSRGVRIGSQEGDSGHTHWVKPPIGLKPKDLVGIPWMLAFALRADGWYLRSDIIWSKPNPMPESVTDRPTKAHEYIFLLSKSQTYYYDVDAIREPSEGSAYARAVREAASGRKYSRGKGHDQRGDNGMSWTKFSGPERNKRSVWTVNSQPFPEAHFATFPEELIKPCILAGCPQGGIVLDPFVGSGTTVLVARELQCKGIGLELNPSYIEIAKRRLSQEVLDFSAGAK